MHFHLRGCHPLWPAFPDRSINTFLSLVSLAEFRQNRSRRRPANDYCPTTPDSPCGSPGLGCSDFARRYSRNHFCFLFLQVLRWFTSLGLLPDPMYSDQDKPCSHGLGFPIRKSPDRRLLASPRGLSQLTASFFACLRQGIHTHALSNLTIKSTSDTKCTDVRSLSPPPYSRGDQRCITCSSNARQNIQMSKNRSIDWKPYGMPAIIAIRFGMKRISKISGVGLKDGGPG